MTMGQIRGFMRSGDRRERRRRAAFIADMHCAASGVMGEGSHVQERIDDLLGG